MTPVKTMCMIIVAMAILSIFQSRNLVQAQSVVNSPSFHRVNFRTGPDGRPNLGGIGNELDVFFGGADPMSTGSRGPFMRPPPMMRLPGRFRMIFW
ncbi:hypothetical protein DPMN_073589 [Dreissena polymorpha]|uniref:Secreted protein n=1 Tax=Dreissena polymorpha TaxID=45954 RepID=A0A9D4HDG7_DREPO|nr:hypothetical protein DPMN_073589 [Dreissena polymorpha]